MQFNTSNYQEILFLFNIMKDTNVITLDSFHILFNNLPPDANQMNVDQLLSLYHLMIHQYHLTPTYQTYEILIQYILSINKSVNHIKRQDYLQLVKHYLLPEMASLGLLNLRICCLIMCDAQIRFTMENKKVLHKDMIYFKQYTKQKHNNVYPYVLEAKIIENSDDKHVLRYFNMVLLQLKQNRIKQQIYGKIDTNYPIGNESKTIHIRYYFLRLKNVLNHGRKE